MTEHFTDPNEYNEYAEWKKAKEAPTPKAGDFVAVPRSDNTIDDVSMGWQIRFIYPDDEGVMTASVVNSEEGKVKDIPISELVKYNP